jgi:hypothetical protein
MGEEAGEGEGGPAMIAPIRCALVIAVPVLLVVLGPSVAQAAPTPAPSSAPSRARPVPFEERRFARVAAALAKDPLFVDMDLTDAVPATDRAAIRASMTRTSRALGVPVFVIVIPNDAASESYASNGTFLNGLRKHVGRDGLYLMIDADAGMDAAAYGVPREIYESELCRPEGSPPAGNGPPFAGLPARVARFLASFADAPAGPPVTREPEVGVPPFGREDPPEEASFWGPFAYGAGELGMIAGLLLYGLVRLPFRPWRTAPRPTGGTPSAPATPSAKWLRSTADKEIRALVKAMDEPDGQPSMGAAWRAADRLYDGTRPRDPGKDADTFLDLIGVIVLCRQELQGRKRPIPACFVNPLHGKVGRTRRRIPHQGRFPVCDGCSTGRLGTRTLRVPDGRAHYEVPGRWQPSGFGARRRLRPTDILESLPTEPPTTKTGTGR